MGKSIWQAESLRIDSHCRIVMKNFDSVSQLQRLSYVHHCAARSRAGRSWLQWTGPGASDQSPEPLVWTVEGDSDRAVNRIESNRLVCGTDSNRIRFFLAESPITT